MGRVEMMPVDRDVLELAEEFQQDNRALFAIVYLEDGLQTLQGAVHNGERCCLLRRGPLRDGVARCPDLPPGSRHR